MVVAALPASLITRFLPATVQAEDFSGTSGTVPPGSITAGGREAGAAEWHLHPLPLLRLHALADLHWVKGGFVLDGTVDADRGGFAASDLEGGGPIADLRDLGLAAGWQGTAKVRVKELEASWSSAGPALKSAIGEISVSDVSAPQVASGAELGGYSLKFANPASLRRFGRDRHARRYRRAVEPECHDPAHIEDAPGLLSGILKERPEAAAALRNQLQNLAQLHARDAQGRIPVDLEFTF